MQDLRKESLIPGVHLREKKTLEIEIGAGPEKRKAHTRRALDKKEKKEVQHLRKEKKRTFARILSYFNHSRAVTILTRLELSCIF